jgi:NTP pyrophosphatase (non-canonical NTP hydrolase)
MFKEAQKEVDDWVKQFKMGYWRPLEQMTRLTEEVGELARELNHRFGPKRKKSTEELKEVGDEIADILFTVICIANALDIDIDEAFKKMMDKYNNRDATRYERVL